MNFLISEGHIRNKDRYIEFARKFNTQLMKINDSQYFKHWLEFMKELFTEASSKDSGRKEKTEKQLERHKMMIKDLRYFLNDYLRKENPESLKLLSQCLGLENA